LTGPEAEISERSARHLAGHVRPFHGTASPGSFHPPRRSISRSAPSLLPPGSRRRGNTRSPHETALRKIVRPSRDRRLGAPSPPHRIGRPTRDLASAAASPSPRHLQRPVLHHQSRRNRPVESSTGDKLPTAIVDPPPTTPVGASLTEAAAPANPLDGRLPTQPPRVPSLEAFGRRPSARADRSRRAGIRNPSQRQSTRPCRMPAAQRR
jgi:hypothetical protein